MDNNIRVAKISASPTENTWSQAYSTLNLYIVLSIKSTNDTGVLNAGKELFERLQREYFSLDDKDLKNIKTSVENAIGDFDGEKEISIILATLKENILYIVTAGESEAVLKRGSKIGAIAKGEAGQVIAFSGQLANGDTVVFETKGFSEKISIDKLPQALEVADFSEISENLTPIIHEESSGTEAALILSYSKIEEATGPQDNYIEDDLPQRKIEEDEIPERIAENEISEDVVTSQTKKSKFPKFPTISIPTFNKFGKRKIIITSIVLLLFILLVSIFFEGKRQENSRANAALESILSPAQEQFDEATSLLSLNQSLALEEFQEIKSSLEASRGDFAEDSEQRKKLDEFIGKVEGEIGKISGGASITNQKEVAENAKLAIFRNGNLITVSSNGVINILDENGESEDEFETENGNVVAITASESTIYLLGDSGITRTTISNGNTTSAIEDIDDTISIDIFGSNIYGLNTATNSIDRYSGASFTQGDYLTGDNELSNPASMTIDGSVFVIDDGALRKFTRGAEDSFAISGLELSNNSLIFTGVDFDNLYVVDKSASKVYIISKTGSIENQLSWSTLSDTDSISVDEENKTIYFTAEDTLYSFTF